MFIVGLWPSSPALCQTEVIVYREALISRTLSGHVLANVDLGAPSSGVPNVLVAVYRTGWKGSLASTTTDAEGAFSLPLFKHRRLYYLRLSLPGTHTLFIKVRIKPSAPNELTLHLIAAT
jgi:hypothetical protein